VQPFVSSQYDHKPECLCDACEEAREPGGLARVLAVVATAIVALALMSASGHAREGRKPEPIKAPAALLEARAACPDTASIVQCRTALVHAIAALRWQRNARLHQGRYGVQHALRLASALYGVPLRALERVGACESHLRARAKNRHSTASGLFQFLDSTWNRAGVPGFSPFDPYASAIAAARLVRRDGGFREWSCQP
jgi:hypothetical protein